MYLQLVWNSWIDVLHQSHLLLRFFSVQKVSLVEPSVCTKGLSGQITIWKHQLVMQARTDVSSGQLQACNQTVLWHSAALCSQPSLDSERGMFRMSNILHNGEPRQSSMHKKLVWILTEEHTSCNFHCCLVHPVHGLWQHSVPCWHQWLTNKLQWLQIWQGEKPYCPYLHQYFPWTLDRVKPE